MTQSGTGITAAQNREAVLVARNAATSSADTQLQTVLSGAHETAAQYSHRLDAIERAIDEAVSRQSAMALDTPGGARQFQQFLAAKHAQIMAVIADAQRTDNEQSTQMTALAAHYKTSLGSDDDWFYGDGPEFHPIDPGGAAAGPNAGPRVPDSLIHPTSFSTSTGWDDDPLDEAEQLAPPGWSMDHHGNWSPPVIPIDGGAAGGGGGRAPV